MPSTNQNPDKGARVAQLVGALAAAEAVSSMTPISAFNLEIALRALQEGHGGTLTIKLPTQHGKAVQLVYEGLRPA